MKVYHSLDEFARLAAAVTTTGTFDGVHLGHREIIGRLTGIAKETGGESVILTFFPHPRMVLYPDDNDLKQINTLDEKISLLEKLGVDHLIVHPFTKEFSRLTATQFVRDILVNRIGTKRLVVGYNHQFGRNREGAFGQLEELSSLYGFKTDLIPEQDIDRVAVSSTRIREALLKGDIRTANKFLGYAFPLSGKVIKGDGIGHSLGFPTANIAIPEKYKLVPAEGIYAVNISVENTLCMGMMYIGKRPVLNGTLQQYEVNIFDFKRDIYGVPITVLFKEKIRDDIHFTEMEDLKKQMEKDKAAALILLSAQA